MTQMSKLSDREFRITMINLLKVLMENKFPLERHFSRDGNCKIKLSRKAKSQKN